MRNKRWAKERLNKKKRIKEKKTMFLCEISFFLIKFAAEIITVGMTDVSCPYIN
jgi:hypothetical protein